MPTPAIFRNEHEVPELGPAIDDYIAAADAARVAAYATQAYRDAAEARRKAERRVVRHLKPLKEAYLHAGSRWALSPEGDLFRVPDDSSCVRAMRAAKAKNPTPVSRSETR